MQLPYHPQAGFKPFLLNKHRVSKVQDLRVSLDFGREGGRQAASGRQQCSRLTHARLCGKACFHRHLKLCGQHLEAGGAQQLKSPEVLEMLQSTFQWAQSVCIATWCFGIAQLPAVSGETLRQRCAEGAGA